MVSVSRSMFCVATLLSLSACGESYAERDARYQVAKKECAEKGVKEAFAMPGPFSREKEVVSAKVALACLSERGFDVDLKRP